MKLGEIENKVCQIFSVENFHLKSNRRDQITASARKLFSQLAYEDGFSMKEIGEWLGKDRSTIWYHIHGKKKNEANS